MASGLDLKGKGLETNEEYCEGSMHLGVRTNVYKKVKQMTVKVKSTPYPISGPATTDQENEKLSASGIDSKYIFVGRIEGPYSPHQAWTDDPEPQSTCSNPAENSELMCQQTVITMAKAGARPNFKENDTVICSFSAGTNGNIYNLQRARFVRIKDVYKTSPTSTSGSSTPSNKSLFANTDFGTLAETIPEGHHELSYTDAGPTVAATSAGTAVPRKCKCGEFCSQYIQAKFYRQSNRTVDDIRMIVIHATGGKGGSNRALKSASRMAKGPTRAVTASKKYTGPTVEYGGKTREACHSGICKEKGVPYQLYEPKSSAHYFVDQGGNIIQGVADKDISYHGTKTNNYSIGIEHTLSTKDPAEYTEKLYDAGAKLGAALAAKYNIPAKRLPKADYKGTGFFAHSDVPKTDHVDPGGAGNLWDWDKYLKKVQYYIDNPSQGIQPAAGCSEDDGCEEGYRWFEGDDTDEKGCYPENTFKCNAGEKYYEATDEYDAGCYKGDTWMSEGRDV